MFSHSLTRYANFYLKRMTVYKANAYEAEEKSKSLQQR